MKAAPGYILVDMKGFDYLGGSQTISGIFNRLKDALATNKVVELYNIRFGSTTFFSPTMVSAYTLSATVLQIFTNHFNLTISNADVVSMSSAITDNITTNAIDLKGLVLPATGTGTAKTIAGIGDTVAAMIESGQPIFIKNYKTSANAACTPILVRASIASGVEYLTFDAYRIEITKSSNSTVAVRILADAT